VLARAIIRDLLTGEAAATRLARVAAIMALAPMIAPAIGAAVLTVADGRAIFLLLGAGGACLFLAVMMGLPETISAKNPEALASRTLARNAACFLGCRAALGNALVAAFLFGGMFAYIAASPFALMWALGVGQAVYSGLFALTAAAIMAGALAGPGLIRRAGRSRVVWAGLMLATGAGVGLVLLASAGLPSAPAVIALVAAYTFTRGLVLPVATAAAMEPMGHAAGLTSGLLGALQMGAAALAASAVGLFDDVLVGMSAVMALFAMGALGCGIGLVPIHRHRLWPWPGRILSPTIGTQ
jgi:DHA1 family bicyclomycin/chloramphenicol resistance-like MFS transporter